MSHSGGKPKHRLTPYIVVLNEQANKSNKFVICHPCKNMLGYEGSIANKFVNTKREYRRHLKNCPHFKSEYGDQCEDIINQTDNEDNAKVDVDQSFANNVHPADDNSAKWNLSSLFVEELPTPPYAKL
jgi:hypothetical protein